MTDVLPTGAQPAAKPLVLAILDRLVPDFRAWVAAGVFALAFYIVHMIEKNPTLLANASFMQMVGMVVGGSGLGVIVLFCYGGTKSGSDVMSAQNKAVIASSPPPADPAA